ncbi:mitotic-spindle organizing protein 1-like [Pollicipes pollicipes]|uniref:mitotic-spindle organizing protein 1-like n=1 Tax=Pollicipes pollicipes TaxID=41117 RepID=UPI001884AD40|nr:mitotic-spindle organizing protein 1-like [Pollicipes pollicipes]XP_037092870.1 mitotic-spindle organizing protein 1-like [Pollicipes pollicipes]XP_037092871.1 mitotic-spindle organizing protein 1-like [Pollicipes pollicipes]XP_037092872.1 mitotic-spindle organizing protein 1-like [Pollicipes pollicipes]XP_037092873.1 mitotic-spindle organizing protein 1-like [Pollicipes pollicipes]XP_037092874.1 mitotic-spindle organizing protein 1-like [Pollicipes pollicipes]XP_037092875.1 mitotic-spindl
MSGPAAERARDKKETFDILMEISNILNTGLDGETLSTCVRLCENGVNPESLANVICELRRESAALREAEAVQPPPSAT